MNVAKANPAIEKACKIIKVLSGDERARAMVEAEEKARMDMEVRLGDAHDKGLQKGLCDVANNLLRKKMPYDDIVEITGLSLDEIKKLAAGLGH